MLTTQARLAMRNRQPVLLGTDLYRIVDIKRSYSNKPVAIVRKISVRQHELIDVNISDLEVTHGEVKE